VSGTRLRRVDCTGPGISRRRRGRGFEYFDHHGEKVSDPHTLRRIRGLAIPPAWTAVWICPDPRGHLQAVGTDAAGRRQYRYHNEWRTRRDAEKFDRMLDFARALPAARETCVAMLTASDRPTRERVLACAVRLLDHGFFRIGTESYAEDNGTFGLATMKKEHVRVFDGAVQFDYPAKGGARRVQHVVDPAVHDVVAALRRRRSGGERLLAYQRNRAWHPVSSEDINEFLKSVVGPAYTAKDFRTWDATVLAAVGLAVSGEAPASKTAQKRAETRAVKEVAHYLGNTPTVARGSYVDPRVFDRYRSGWTIAGALHEIGQTEDGGPAIQGPIEHAVLDLLEERGSEYVEPTAA
jgi:DNA topoisomerase I